MRLLSNRPHPNRSQPLELNRNSLLRNLFYRGALLAVVTATLTACSTEPETTQTAEPSDRLSGFRVRTDFAVPLNADSGWASAVNQPAQVRADEPFRLRLEIEHPAPSKARHYGLQVRRNKGEWQPLGAENFPQPAKELELNFEQRPARNIAEQWQWVSADRAAMSWAGEPGEGYLQLQADAQANEGFALAVARYHTHWEAIEFAADVRLPKAQTGRSGLVFGYDDADNYHRVDLKPGTGVQLVHVTGGMEQTLASHPFDIQIGEWAELKIIMEGRDVIVEYADEALVFTETLASAVASPRVGVFADAGSALELPALFIEGLPRSPRVSIMEADSFEHGESTLDQLAGSDLDFVGGAGISFADQTPAVPAAAGQSEWEFPLVIRRFSDGAALNETGDRFEFRVVNQAGDVLPTAAPVVVTLEVPKRLLGGTFVETPMRIGPWQTTDGDLYFLMEPAETDNMLMTVKSVDGGDTWVEMDGANRPATGDLEGFASVLLDDKIHMLHQTSDHVFYHVFRTADHPEQPDTWAIRDERLASPVEPPTQVADIAVRSDGSVLAVYGGPEKIHYRTRSPAGAGSGEWSRETVIDADQAPNLSGPALVMGAEDVVHLTYTGDDGTAWYRQLHPNGELTERRLLASGLGTNDEDIGSILPPVYLPETQSVSVIYRLDNGQLWERQVSPQGEFSEPALVSERNVVQNAVDADQTGADAIGYRNSVHVLFIEADTGHLYHAARTADGSWRDAEPQVTNAEVQWVRGAVVESKQGEMVYGYVYDAGSDGGSGKNRYGDISLSTNTE